MKQLLNEYIQAAFSGLWVQTMEPHEAAQEIATLCQQEEYTFTEWDIARGARINDAWQGADNPVFPLKNFNRGRQDDKDSPQTAVVVLHNYHRFLTSAIVVQALFNAVIAGKQDRTFFIVLSHQTQLPPELDKVFVLIDHPLPAEPELLKIAQETLDAAEIGQDAATTIKAASGLTRYEAEGAFALSVIRHNNLDENELWELKQSALKKSGLLQLYRGDEAFHNVIGADAFKKSCQQMLRPGKRPGNAKARGVLLLGPSGTGKSALCKAIGNECHRPMARLLTDKIKDSGYGVTEQRIGQVLRTVDAMAPCIFMVDEIEKLLAGASRKGDPGATLAMVGVLLEWLNDHDTDVFTVVTSNDVSELPPEFSRAERFDGTFCIDLPTPPEREAIWSLYAAAYEIECFDPTTDERRPWQDVADENWTGAEIKACCRLAALKGSTLANEAKSIIPTAISSSEKVQALRGWASGRCLDAATGSVYQINKAKTAPTARRNLKCSGTKAS